MDNALWFVLSAIISGGFPGTNFPMAAALVADYHGETNNAVNYCSIYSWKALGGSFASGIAGFVMTGSVFSTLSPTTPEWIRGFVFGAMLALLASLVFTFAVKRPTVEELRRAEAKASVREKVEVGAPARWSFVSTGHHQIISDLFFSHYCCQGIYIMDQASLPSRVASEHGPISEIALKNALPCKPLRSYVHVCQHEESKAEGNTSYEDLTTVVNPVDRGPD